MKDVLEGCKMCKMLQGCKTLGMQAWEGGRLLHAKLGMQFDSFQMEVATQHGRAGGCCGDSESVEGQEMLLSCA